MKKVLLITLFAVVFGSLAAQAQGNGQVVGTQCWINGKLVGGFPPGYNCPAPSGGSGSGSSSSPVDSQLYGAVYDLSYRFTRWLLGGSSDPQGDALRQQQQQQMMEELARRQAEAERQHREEEARRIAAMYNRLARTLKLNGLPHLELKTSGIPAGGLQLKMGDSAQGYGIQGLPGIYTGGPRSNPTPAPQAESTLKLKMGDDATGANQASNQHVRGFNEDGVPGIQNIYQGGPSPFWPSDKPAVQPSTDTPGLHLKMGDAAAAPPTSSNAPQDPASAASQPATTDFNKMTPQQLADAAEAFSKLPPEEQQRLMAAAQAATPQTPAQHMTSLQQQANASQSAATATVPEDASAKARIGFDNSADAGSVQIGTTTAPASIQPPAAAVAVAPAPVPPPSPTATPAPPPVANDWIKQYLFPANQPSGPFPNDPNPLLNNPLREEQKQQAELKTWDDWAIQRATHIHDSHTEPGQIAYPQGMVQAGLNRSAVQQYAPELLNRYSTDAAFRQSVDLRLQYTDEHVALAYYQGLAEAHKAAILEFHAELDQLTAAGKLDRLTPLDDQYRLHPERRQIVQSAWDRASADEQAALAKAQAEGNAKVDKEYQFVFQLIRGDTAQQR